MVNISRNMNTIHLTINHINKKPYKAVMANPNHFYDLKYSDVYANERQRLNRHPDKAVIIEYNGKRKLIRWAEAQ